MKYFPDCYRYDGGELNFLHCIYAFRSILYTFRSLPPKITENLPIN